MKFPTTEIELAEVVRLAVTKEPDAVRTVRHLARSAGYVPRVGGWIYKDGRTVAHGWANFAACAVADNAIMEALSRALLAEIETDPTPDPVVVAAGLRHPEQEKVEAERRGDYTHEFEGPEYCSRMVGHPDGAIRACREPIKSAIHDPQAYAAYHAEVTAALAEWSGKPGKIVLSPRRDSHSRDVTDAELIQLLTLLDHGVEVTRSLYQPWRIERTAALATAIDPEKLDRTARAAIDTGLADYTYTSVGGYVLRAEPIHLARTNDETWCGRRIQRAGHDRIRYATGSVPGPKHGRCLERSAPPALKVDEVVRFRHDGAATGRLFRIVEVNDLDGDMVRVVWDNPPEDFDGWIKGQWVSIGMVERVPQS